MDSHSSNHAVQGSTDSVIGIFSTKSFCILLYMWPNLGTLHIEISVVLTFVKLVL